MTPKRRRSGIAYLFLSPWILGVLFLTIGPMLASLYLSFTDYDLFNSPRWVGVDNYVKLFGDDPRYLHSVGVTLRYVAWSVPLKLMLALAVALLLNSLRGKGQAFAGDYRFTDEWVRQDGVWKVRRTKATSAPK